MKGVLNVKRWLLAGIASFAAMFLTDLFFHAWLLKPLYLRTHEIWRGTDDLRWLMVAGSFLFNLLFAFIYTKGYEERRPGLGQGIRYGLLIGALFAIPQVHIWYVVLPVPLELALGWAAGYLASCALGGALVGSIYHP